MIKYWYFIQKLELIARLHTIVEFDGQSDGYRLLNALRLLCSLAFSQSLTIDDLDIIHGLAKDLIEMVKKMDTVHKFKVSPKMHNLLHYKDHIKLFGPLALRSTLAIERKHKTCTDWAVVMGCFKNPAMSFLNRHQSMMAIKCQEFIKSDFFSIDLIGPTLSELPKQFVKLKPSRGQGLPHTLNKNVIRKMKHEPNKWFLTTSFWYHDDVIMCCGHIYNSNYQHLDTANQSFINITNLNHVNDWLCNCNGTFQVVQGIL